MFEEISLNFLIRSGATVCISYGPGKVSKDSYLVAKIGFDTVENGPLKVAKYQPKVKLENSTNKHRLEAVAPHLEPWMRKAIAIYASWEREVSRAVIMTRQVSIGKF